VTGPDDNDGLALALAVIGDRWTLPVLRAIDNGDVRFEQIQSGLGIARNILARRLETLVSQGVVRREPYTDRPVRNEYRLTSHGLKVRELLQYLEAWGNRWGAGPAAD
jgi:DNA-binding HxlR family transcriptional regulator